MLMDLECRILLVRSLSGCVIVLVETLRACLHGGGGPQVHVGEVTRLSIYLSF